MLLDICLIVTLCDICGLGRGMHTTECRSSLLMFSVGFV